MPDSVLRFEHVSVHFGGTTALNDVSFSVNTGETRILFGTAGAGKSVVLKTAVGLAHADQGKVFLFDQDITNMKETDLFGPRAKVGILFQESALFDSLTVQENVAYPLVNRGAAAEAKDIDGRVREALKFVELENTLEKFPAELSGGMRRRVGIARAAVSEPPLILYDSPTAGLDPITANTIVALVVKERQSRNTTSLIVTHRFQDGQILANYRWNKERGKLEETSPDEDGPHRRTRFMVFQEGRLVFEGTQQELEQNKDPYVSKFVKHESKPYAHG